MADGLGGETGLLNLDGDKPWAATWTMANGANAGAEFERLASAYTLQLSLPEGVFNLIRADDSSAFFLRSAFDLSALSLAHMPCPSAAEQLVAKRRGRYSHIVLMFLVLLVVSPQPAVTPLKTITTIRVTPFCTALREAVGPTVLPLLRNKPIIGRAQSLFIDMAHASLLHGESPRMTIDLDMARLSDVVGGLVKNIEAAESGLEALNQMELSSDSKQRLQVISNSLEAVLAKQRDMLNVFSGTYASYTSNELNSETIRHFDAVTTVALVAQQFEPVSSQHPPRPQPTSAPNVDLNSGARIANTAHPATANAFPQALASMQPVDAPAKSVDLGLIGQTPFARLFNDITTQQVAESALESNASQLILNAAASCRGEK